MTIDTAIDRATKRLINEARSTGICENFGQNEVMKIREKFIDVCDYSDEMNRNRRKLDRFDEWCTTYTGR